MDELSSFVKKIKGFSSQLNSNIPIEQARQIILELNNFLFTYKDIEFIESNSGSIYFSEFHKYWHNHHKEILNASVDETKCSKVADALHNVYLQTQGKAFSEIWDTYGLKKDEVCTIRLLTANQDFNGSREFKELADVYNIDNSIFDIDIIEKDPAEFTKKIKVAKLSQNDKRIDYARNICKFLKEHNAQPNTILNVFNNDVFAFRQALINYPSAGYGNKKTDMLIRDMVVLGIWDNVKNFDKIDVASDVNTIKIALRTGILKTEIPLLSSFIDIFDYQYSYIEDMNAKAWRKVWEIWQLKYPTETIQSPCLLDYFIYNVIGKQFCNRILAIFKCEDGKHEFKWHSSRNKTCQKCYKNGIKTKKAILINKIFPCSDDDGEIAIRNTDFGKMYPFITECPFKNICNEINKTLQPPKAISIKGQTGWESAYSKTGEGGGGLRS